MRICQMRRPSFTVYSPTRLFLDLYAKALPVVVIAASSPLVVAATTTRRSLFLSPLSIHARETTNSGGSQP